MACIEMKSKKYQTRKSPAFHAKDCKGLKKKGKNGKMYVSAPDKKGIYKWKPTKITLKHKGKTYIILDNGSDVFLADISPSTIQVYEHEANHVRGKKVIDMSFQNVFIGDNLLKEKDAAPKGTYPGNSILVKKEDGKYVYVGSEIYSFETIDGEEIQTYYSPVGNSVVPYPYAVGEHHTYFMLEKVVLPNELLDLKKDAYGQLYGYTVKDKELVKQIQDTKKKFNTKLIHKRR